jgi:hypothetical protein
MQAQLILNNPPVSTGRSLIRVQYSNIGLRGVSLEYPYLGGGAGSYGGISSTIPGVAVDATGYTFPYATSVGEAVWTLTSDGQVALNGPRPTPWIGQYIRPVPYDPKGRPEESWGVVNPLRGLWKGGGLLPALATYWPGITKTDEGSIYAGTSPETTRPVQIANYRLHAYIRDIDLPEEVLIAQWTNTKQGILTQARVHDWSNPDFDDFVIVEYIFTNLGDFDGDGQEDRPGQTRPQERVFFAFVNYELPTKVGSWWFYGRYPGAYDDIYAYSDAAGYRGVFPRGLKASVWRDSDNPATSWDDTGEPFYFKESFVGPASITGRAGQTEGQMQAAATWAMAPLAFRNTGPSHAFNPKDKRMGYVDPVGEQPYAARWWKARSDTDYDDPTPERDPEKKLYDEMTAQKIQDNPNEANAGDRTGYVHAQVYGPYTLRPGESAKIIMAYAAGHPAQMRADSKQGTGAMDLLTWDRSSEPVEKKQTEMKTLGEQALLENLRLAQFAYDSEYRIPAAPTNAFIAADDLTSSPNAHQQVSWVDDSDRAINPYYKEADVIGYRVYRSTWYPAGPWELMDTIEKGKGGKTVNGRWTYANGRYTYEDLLSAAGFEYYYSVRPFARGHADWSVTLSDGSARTLSDIPVARARANVTKGYESGWGPSTARTNDGIGRRPFQPATPEADRLERKVRVVPNPYYADGLHKYPNSEDIRFVNLPRKCKVHIYSVSGDWIQTIEHDETVTVEKGGILVPKTAGQRGEAAFWQYTWNLSGQISTGLYFFAVVSEVPENMGKVQRGSFVVIK